MSNLVSTYICVCVRFISPTFLNIVTFLSQQSKAKRDLTKITSIEMGGFFVYHVKSLIDLVSEIEINA